MKFLPTFSDVERAHQVISRYAHNTPVLTSNSINSITGGKLFFKCENFQKVGAFKFRGACNAVFSICSDEGKPGKGVATHSSGNHAAALALAAKMQGIDAHIVLSLIHI